MPTSGKLLLLLKVKCKVVLFSKHNYNDQVKEEEVGKACRTNGERRNAYRTLVGKPEGRRTLGKRRRLWVENMKMDLRTITWGGMDWIDLAQDRD